LISKTRNRTSFEGIAYGLYLYFLGFSFRNASKALSSRIIKRSHVAIWNWVQRYRPKRIIYKRRKVSEFIIDETQIRVGNNYFWIWIAIEPKERLILDVYLSAERNMFVVEKFLNSLIKDYGKHTLSTDGGTWYPYACRLLKVNHHLHSTYEKSIIERTIQYIKDRTEYFDDYFPCRTEKCRLIHLRNWLKLFVDYHNREVID
jgi:putative transposase